MKYWLAIFVAIFFTLSFPLVVFAQNNFKSGEFVTLAAGEVVNKDYFATGNNVLLDGTVNGDVYLAGGDVTVNGVINGDLLAAGGNLNINGVVTGNVRAAGGSVNVNGKVGRNITMAGGNLSFSPGASINGSLTAAGGNLNLLSPIGKEANLAGGQVNIGNSVGGDVNAATGQLTIAPAARVNGNLTYWSDNKVNINQEASISGTVTQNIPPKKTVTQYQTPERIASKILPVFQILGFLTALIIGSLLLRLVPEFTNRATELVISSPVLSLGIGFLSLAVTPILVILLLITVVGIPIAVVWTFFVIFDLWLGKIFVSLALGKLIMKYFNQTWNVYLALMVGLAVYYIIGLIPVIGGLFGFMVGLTGLGVIILAKRNYYLDLSKKKII